MKRLTTEKIGSHSILTNLLIAIMLIFAGSLFLMSVYSIGILKNENDDLNQSNLESSSSILANTMKRHLVEMNNNAYTVGADTTLKKLKYQYSVEPDAPLNYVKLESYVNEQLVQLEKLLGEMVGGVVYITNGHMFYTYSHIARLNINLENALPKDKASKFSQNADIYPPMKNPYFHYPEYVMPIVYDLNGESDQIIFLLSMSKLNTLFRDHFQSFFDDLEIISSTGEVLLPSWKKIDYELAKANGNKIKLNNRSYSVMTTTFDKFNWQINLAKDNSAYENRFAKIIMLTITMSVMMISIAYVAILYIYGKFRKPFDSLSRLMKKNSENVTYEQFDYKKDDEIGQLSTLYNEMIEEIESLVMDLEDKIVELQEEKKMKEWEQEQKRLAEIKALQAQINPHFLYNALNAIVWMAEDHNDQDTKEMTLKLANFYRIGLSKGSDTIPLATELEHAQNYLWIQKQRYEKIEYRFLTDDSLNSEIVPKLILQPLIENAIYHGIKPMEEKGSIVVTTEKKEDHIKLSVMNTGLEIRKDQLWKIRMNLEDGIIDSNSGYGIYNVNNRLRLTYGQKASLVIESGNGKTTSIITIPLTRHNEDKNI